MLLNPQNDKQIWDPDPQDSQAVEASVAAGADRNQPVGMIDAGLTVVHMEPRFASAGSALAVIPLQNPVT
jgi:hypothetical protein